MNPTRLLTSTFTDKLDSSGTLLGDSPSGRKREPLRRLARAVAFALVILVSIGMTPLNAIAKSPTDQQFIANYVRKVTSFKQYKCFYSLAYKESRWNFSAQNGSHYGFMQGHSIYLKTATPIQQLLWSWNYVAIRYGVTALDEPDWCKALDHLERKGWH